MLGLLLLIALYWTSPVLLYVALTVSLPIWLAYSVGMADYARRNNDGTREKEMERMWASLMEEWKEFNDEVKQKNILGMISEFGDVVHCVIKYNLIRFFPLKLLMRHFIWFLIFWCVIPTTWKHGWRYFWTGCIRNHKNENNLGHDCSYCV